MPRDGGASAVGPLAPAAVTRQTGAAMSQPQAEIAIRLARAAFNRALAQGDLAAIKPLLAPDAVLVTGTDSAVIAGRVAQLAAWKREFAVPADRRNLYTRRPERIEVSPVEPIAMEHGGWTCAVADAATASGSYSAKWRKGAGGWQVEAEIYLTLA